MMRHIAALLVRHAAGTLPGHRAQWAVPMQHEVDAIENDMAALRWAVGCVVASYTERTHGMKTTSLQPLAGMIGAIVMLFGGFLLAGGNVRVILEALPTTLITVGLGALATTAIVTIGGGPGIFASLGAAFRGRQYQRADYRTLAGVLTDVLSGQHAPVVGDAAAAMIRDAKVVGDQSSPYLDAFLQTRIQAIAADRRRAVRVLHVLARNLIWLGGAALMLGLMKTFASLTEVPEVVGGMFAHALCLPLVGVFLGAVIVRPLAARLEAAIDDDTNFTGMIRTAFLARAAGVDATIAVRTALGALPADVVPDSIGDFAAAL